MTSPSVNVQRSVTTNRHQSTPNDMKYAPKYSLEEHLGDSNLSLNLHFNGDFNQQQKGRDDDDEAQQCPSALTG